MSQRFGRLCGFRGAVLAMLAVAGPLRAQPADYDGHRVVRIDVRDEQQLAGVLELTNDVWSENIGIGPLDVRMSPAQYDLLKASGLPHQVLIPDVQALIDSAPIDGGLASSDPFAQYMSFAQVLSFMNNLAAARPDLVQVISLGPSLEGRNITGVRISGPGGGKPAVFYHGCQHAREWITVATIVYLADRLVAGYDTDPNIRTLVDRAEWFLVPVANPDGYVYTWTSSRLWRKNRRNNGNGTFGVDLNRNWGVGWGGPGSSGNTSDETYRGPAAFSEPETRALRDFVLAHPNIAAFEDVHSYSQLILWPWGYTADLPPDQADFAYIGQTMAAQIAEATAREYTPGPTYQTIYPAAGASLDWVYSQNGIRALAYELRDTGDYGFLLPAEQIRPTCEEVFPTLLFLADWTTAGVRIAIDGGAPKIIPPAHDYTMNFRVTPDVGPIETIDVRAYIRTSPAQLFQPLHVNEDEGRFSVTLPGRACGAQTEFYIQASTSSGAWFSPPGGPEAAHKIPVGSIDTIFFDDGESLLGWQSSGAFPGAWTLGEPLGTTQFGQYAQPPTDHGPGTQCYFTGQGQPGGASAAADVDSGPVRLTSPRLVLAGTDPTLEYYRWFYDYTGVSPGEDRLLVEASNDDGGTWHAVETVAHDPNWRRTRLRLADVVAPTNYVRLRFSVTDVSPDSLVEAAIDDVLVTRVVCAGAPLIGDMDCDGLVDNFDIDPFVLALLDPAVWQQSYPACELFAADANGDGNVNNFDIDAFVAVLLSQ